MQRAKKAESDLEAVAQSLRQWSSQARAAAGRGGE